MEHWVRVNREGQSSLLVVLSRDLSHGIALENGADVTYHSRDLVARVRKHIERGNEKQ